MTKIKEIKKGTLSSEIEIGGATGKFNFQIYDNNKKCYIMDSFYPDYTSIDDFIYILTKIKKEYEKFKANK